MWKMTKIFYNSKRVELTYWVLCLPADSGDIKLTQSLWKCELLTDGRCSLSLQMHNSLTPSLGPWWVSTSRPAFALSGGKTRLIFSTSSLEMGKKTSTWADKIQSHMLCDLCFNHWAAGYTERLSKQFKIQWFHCVCLWFRCWSFLGRQAGGQAVSLQKNGCVFINSVQHEVLHALGFHHEHVRSDRDSYVNVNMRNVQPGQLTTKPLSLFCFMWRTETPQIQLTYFYYFY